MNIRNLQKGDRKQFLKLINTFRPIDTNMDITNFITLYDKIFSYSDIFVYIINRNIVGCITIIPEQKFINYSSIYLHIEDLVVDPLYQEKGIGSKLIKFSIDYGKKIKARKIILNCAPELKKFYLKHNFIEDKIQMFFPITQ